MHITLPADWQQVEMTEAAIIAQIQALTASNPLMAESMNQVLTTGQYKILEYYAIGYEGLTPVGTIVVGTLPLGGASLDAAAPTLEGQLKQIGATDIKTSHATLLGATAVVFEYHLDVKDGATTTATTSRMYLIPVGDAAYDVVVGCLGSNVTSCLADGETMVQGMTIGP